jgi:hypothetical protein
MFSATYIIFYLFLKVRETNLISGLYNFVFGSRKLLQTLFQRQSKYFLPSEKIETPFESNLKGKKSIEIKWTNGIS